MLRETSRQQLNGLAAELLRPEDLVIVIVGDLPVIRDELEDLGLPMVELDENGRPVSGD